METHFQLISSRAMLRCTWNFSEFLEQELQLVVMMADETATINTMYLLYHWLGFSNQIISCRASCIKTGSNGSKYCYRKWHM